MIDYPQINPVAVKMGPLAIHWYGIMYVLGFALAWLLGRQRCLRHGAFEASKMGDLIFYSALGVILGGRLGYVVFYNLSYYVHHPTMIFAVWDGGMSFHGGFIGVLVALFLYGRVLNKSLLQMTDFIAPLVPLGLAAGRIGNFINGELWGRVSHVPWAMIFPGDPLKLPRHPSQLYEFFLEGIILFLVVWCFSMKKRPNGAVSFVFLAGYGVMRFIVEFFRQPDPQLGFVAFGWMTRGQELSIPMIIIGVVMLYVVYRRPWQKDKINEPGK